MDDTPYIIPQTDGPLQFESASFEASHKLLNPYNGTSQTKAHDALSDTSYFNGSNLLSTSSMNNTSSSVGGWSHATQHGINPFNVELTSFQLQPTNTQQEQAMQTRERSLRPESGTESVVADRHGQLVGTNLAYDPILGMMYPFMEPTFMPINAFSLPNQDQGVINATMDPTRQDTYLQPFNPHRQPHN
ncbi:hypothetical protein P280DRAFT_484159 [Massarina eburnea CBS 473.64]|uniref:Uncharacterized protein n=1 Tax=Massarina eburnea CBS 473.64 TaxID=1395130 RepID=A0A6A6RLN8_9PLEO|nr:hypothetical protein P280DRAFT_484159 [Massarina eburnea CBS 473.64]